MSLSTARDRYRQDGAECYYCGVLLSPGLVTVDHKIPRCRGGSSTPTNLVPACRRCNNDKGALTEIEFLAVRHDPQLRKQMAVKVGKMVQQIIDLERKLANPRYALGIDRQLYPQVSN